MRTGLVGVVRLALGFVLVAGVAVAGSPDQVLLKDYRPRSIYAVPETVVERARHPVIDLHTHAYARTEAEVEEWVRTMDAVGMEKSIILTGKTGEEFDALVRLYGRHPGRFELWCGLDYTGYDRPGFGPGAVAELERCRAAGATGVGELGDKGKGLFYGAVQAWGMHFDDARMDPILRRCGELGLPVSIHVADPMWMYQPMDETNDGLMNAFKWRLDDQTNILGHAELLGTLENAVRKHPGTTFLACHFANCSYDLGRLGQMLDRYPNLFADISARYAETAPIPRFVRAFYEAYQDRLVYGTDMGIEPSMYRITFRILETEDEHFYDRRFFSYHWPLHGLGLPDAVLRKVYRENALTVLRQRQRQLESR